MRYSVLHELNTLDVGRSRSMCGVIVVDAESYRSTWHGRDAYIHDHCLRYVITLRFSINCSAVICSPTILFANLREATSETYGPRVYFPSYKFPIYNISFRSNILAIFYFVIYKPEIPKIFTLSFIYLYQRSLLQVTVKGLTTPLSRWVQVCLIVCAGIQCCVLSPTRLIPWFLN